MSRRIPLILSVLVILTLVLGACGGSAQPTATPVPAAPFAPAATATPVPPAATATPVPPAPTEPPVEEVEEAVAEPTEEPVEEVVAEPTAEASEETAEDTEEEAAEETATGEFDLIAAVDAYMSSIPEGFLSVGRLEAFQAILDTGEATVIDVREVGEYEAGHVPGAINIPLRTVAQNLDLIPADKPVVIYCASGHRASMVTTSLRLLGYDNVRSFPGGWKAWSDAGEEVATEAVEATPVEPKEVSAEMLAAVDGFLSAIPEGYYAVGTVERLADAMDAGALLVDVREPSETADGVIPGALELPIRTVIANLDQIPTDQQVILYCASGHRAGLTLAALQTLGYTNVRSFPPGYGAWEAANP